MLGLEEMTNLKSDCTFSHSKCYVTLRVKNVPIFTSLINSHLVLFFNLETTVANCKYKINKHTKQFNERKHKFLSFPVSYFKHK